MGPLDDAASDEAGLWVNCSATDGTRNNTDAFADQLCKVVMPHFLQTADGDVARVADQSPTDTRAVMMVGHEPLLAFTRHASAEQTRGVLHLP